MLVLGKKRVELLEAFPIEMSVVVAKDTELEMNDLSVELASLFEIPGLVVVDAVKRPELCFVKSISSDMVVFCFIEVMGKVF